ncbi:MAG: TfoX/Sxy family protein [Gemmataceae bacterium]
MPVDPAYRDQVESQLDAVVPELKLKPMFGGLGIYSGPHFFALIGDDTLYFKVDDLNRPDFESRGMEPFRPFAEKASMNYYRVPDDVLHDPGMLRDWSTRAIDVAKRKSKSQKPRRKKSP